VRDGETATRAEKPKVGRRAHLLRLHPLRLMLHEAVVVVVLHVGHLLIQVDARLVGHGRKLGASLKPLLEVSCACAESSQHTHILQSVQLL
jgi:hypothetical protein